MFDIGGLIKYVREEPSLHLSPAQRQLIVNRLSFEPTEGEMRRAREQVVSRVPSPSEMARALGA